ncbi:putative amidase [Iris pallida]|uniref:Amidase n=1 Tax=Iris pallida TaxID=29817 RepID=A0AAX6F0E4_IRIPA|nr:putative amidase [Iris pallida]
MKHSVCNCILLLLLSSSSVSATSDAFDIDESTIAGVQSAFAKGTLTSRALVEYYLDQIRTLNPLLHAVVEVNPDALDQADQADREKTAGTAAGGGLHGIPILLKDVIATDDRLNTTAGSLAMVGSAVPRDAAVVRKLRAAGAVVLGKASMSEWHNFRTRNAPSGWSARGGQSLNPYVLLEYVCGSSAGSAIAVAANMVSVSLAAETDGSISCPSASASVVGIKPTVGLTSRAGVIPLSPRMDTVGPICRTVADAVEVLEAIVGYDDERDGDAMKEASRFVPQDGYKQFLKAEGLKGKRVGILRKRFFDFPRDPTKKMAFEAHFATMRQKGATLIDDLEIANMSIILDSRKSGEQAVMLAEFKISLNAYLSELLHSQVRSLQDVIDFNNKHRVEERIDDLGQSTLLAAQETTGLGPVEQRAVANMARLSAEGLERLMKENQLDTVVAPDASATSIFAIGGYPGISVPAGYGERGRPFGIFFGGLRGSEPKLIEIAYGFEQATKARKAPSFLYDGCASTGRVPC